MGIGYILLIMGIGYVFAMIQIYEVHAGRDGRLVFRYMTFRSRMAATKPIPGLKQP